MPNPSTEGSANIMQTAAVYKNLGLLMFVFACALMLAAGAVVHGQGRGVGNGKQNGDLWENRQNKGQTKKKDDREDRNDRADRRRGDNDDREDRINGRDRRGNQSVRFAYQRGYRTGFNDGKRAARSNSVNYNNTSFPTNGNRNGWGNSREWRRAYEDGYRRGYRDGYNRNRRTNDRRTGDRRILGIPLPY